MPCSLTSAPLRVLQVAAVEPISTTTLRLRRSTQVADAARVTMTSLSRMSATASGYMGRPRTAKLVIWASG